jgi:hypothetical protein
VGTNDRRFSVAHQYVSDGLVALVTQSQLLKPIPSSSPQAGQRLQPTINLAPSAKSNSWAILKLQTVIVRTPFLTRSRVVAEYLRES